MAFTLETVVPWGRSFDEYRRMFSLADADLQKRILGCADGPASFNVELTETGGTVISADPLYRCSADEIRQRIEDTSQELIEQTRNNMEEFVWSIAVLSPRLVGVKARAGSSDVTRLYLTVYVGFVLQGVLVRKSSVQ